MKVAIIGCGNMGTAIARGLAQGSIINASDITCSDPKKENTDRLRQANPALNITSDNIKAVKGADIIILAVKPWLIQPVIFEIKPHLDYEKQIIVSVAATITFDQLNAYLLKDTIDDFISTPPVFRIIPNIAIEVSQSMTFVASSNTTDEQEELILRIFNELGTAIPIDENLIGAGIALASSGIAFAFKYIRASCAGGVELGFYPAQAQEIVVQTVKGAVALLQASHNNPEVEIDRVTTPGGTTIKGLNEMELSGFTASIIKGLKATK